MTEEQACWEHLKMMREGDKEMARRGTLRDYQSFPRECESDCGAIQTWVDCFSDGSGRWAYRLYWSPRNASKIRQILEISEADVDAMIRHERIAILLPG